MAARTSGSRKTRDLLRVRVSMVDSDPEIWRLLELDADLTLEQLHQVLQVAVGWRDQHLHLFTDIDPYERLRPVDGGIREPRRWMPAAELEELGGLPEAEWTLGQVLSEQAGPLYYEYDFGDGWLHRIEFIERLTVPAVEPVAHLERGERRAPPEDAGGISGYSDLLEVLADPGHERHREAADWVAATVGPWRPFDPEELDVDAVNQELALLFPAAGGTPDAGSPSGEAGTGLPPLIAGLVERMPAGLRPEFRSYVRAADPGAPVVVDADAAERMVAPYLWLIRRVGADGVALTAAGWLPPVVVQQAMTELGWEDRWIGKHNREDQTLPVLRLREQAQHLGLLRKHKGRLLLSAAARKLVEDPVELWFFLARALAHRHRHDSARDATLLLALELAAGHSTGRKQLLSRIAFGLDALGWAAPDGLELPLEAVDHVLEASWDVVAELGALPRTGRRGEHALSPPGRAFARAVLRS